LKSCRRPKKSLSGFQQAGKKEGGLGERVFVRRQASGNARRVNQQNPLDFSQNGFGFRLTSTTKLFS